MEDGKGGSCLNCDLYDYRITLIFRVYTILYNDGG